MATAKKAKPAGVKISKPSRVSKPKPKKAKKPPVKLWCKKCTFTYKDGFVFKCEKHITFMEELRADRKAKSLVPFVLCPERNAMESAARARKLAISKIKTPRGWTRNGVTTEGVLFSRGKPGKRKFKLIPLTK